MDGGLKPHSSSFAIIAVSCLSIKTISLLGAMNIKPKLGYFLIFGLLVVGTWYSRTPSPQRAPAAVFKTINGDSINLSALQGKPVLITFWASDCASCLLEIPDLIDLHQEFNPQGLTIIAVAMYYDPPNHVLETVNSRQLPYAVALDPMAEHAQAFGNVQFTPTSFLIDKQGLIVMQKIGRFDLAAVQVQLRKI